jgi:hypothetical protein
VLLPRRFGDHFVETTAHPQLGRVLQRQHRRGVATRMMLYGGVFGRRRSACGQPRREHAREQ